MTYSGKSILLNETLMAPWLSSNRPWATYVLIAINFAVFLAMCVFTNGASILSPTSEQLVGWGANWAPLTLSGQEWRLVTQGFLHIGAFHLLMNMWVLWLFGRLCERLFGSTRYLIIYFLSGIGAALFSNFSFLRFSEMVSAGSSGPICGILGAYFAFIFSNRSGFEPAPFNSLMKKFGEYALLIVGYGLLMHADNSAHLGGVITGAILAIALLPKSMGNSISSKQLLGISVICLSLCGICFLETTSVIDSEGVIPLYQLQVLRDQKHKEEAAIGLKEFVKQHPKNVTAYVQLASCELELGDGKASADALRTALQIDPKNDAALNLSAFQAFQEGDYDECLRISAKISAASPYHKLHRSFYAARIDGIRGHLEQALAKSDVEPASANEVKMMIYSQASMDSEAVKLADAILKTDANNSEALYVRLLSDWRKKDYKKVLKQASFIGASTPPDSQTRSYAAFAYSIAANMLDDSHPDLLLAQYQTDILKGEWTKSIGDYLENRISESQLIARASDQAQKTESHAYVGLNLLAHHHTNQAKPYLSWVVQNGVPHFFEYMLCDFQLKNLTTEINVKNAN
jgi:membrane associated rhomboid family serine protease/lipoprotein NlpI